MPGRAVVVRTVHYLVIRSTTTGVKNTPPYSIPTCIIIIIINKSKYKTLIVLTRH